VRKRLVTTLVGLVLAMGAAGPAGAGGGHLAPVLDRYEPGSTATMVGYTGTAVPDEPFYAYLRPFGDDTPPALDDGGIYVGELVMRQTAHRGYLRLRVSITFDVPAALPPGQYELTYCVDPCTATFLGDLVPSALSVGVDPPRPVVRMWAPDEPEIANLAPPAVLVGPGFQTTAGALRAPPTTVAAPPSVLPPATPAPPAPAPPIEAGDMELVVPIILVLASAAATALVLSVVARAHRQMKGRKLALR
jgi:hypothetical protein